MSTATLIPDEKLKEIRSELSSSLGSKPIRAWMIVDELKKQDLQMAETEIRSRFIEMGEPLTIALNIIGNAPASARPKVNIITTVKRTEQPKIKTATAAVLYPAELMALIPRDGDFTNYVERDLDRRLAVHYDAGKHPISQGKQGTGKTLSHMYYAWKMKLPFLLISCYEDFKLSKLFGDKTIVNGTIRFQEGVFTKAIQFPSVVLFDEINAVSNANTFDFHALLQNRELFIKDADDGKGRAYALHPDCRIGFAQNPRSAKYIGGSIKPSNFLGRCTYLTYPEFSRIEISRAMLKKFDKVKESDVQKFIEFYFACTDAIDRAKIPVDISIRQLTNMLSLYQKGLTLKESIEDGLTSILEAISQPDAKQSFTALAIAVWGEELEKGRP